MSRGLDTVKVTMWGTTIGYLHKDENDAIGFQYDPDFLDSGIELSPIQMPLSKGTYSFPHLPERTFHGLPGLFADSIPDKFGNLVLKNYLESFGRDPNSLSPLERLSYTGKRGMGALEYEPAVLDEKLSSQQKMDIDALSQIAQEILSRKEKMTIDSRDDMIAQLMESGSSVGGARAKILIAWNEKTNEVRSGQIDAGSGFDYWLLKFGNIRNNRDKDAAFDDPEYTRIEYAYYLMATAAGIKMSECRLLTEKGSTHFLTKRFDRFNGQKLHMQSLGALAHLDFNSPRTDSYDAAFLTMKRLGLSREEEKEFFRRMVFNHYALNFDDHVKNISFLMNKNGEWSLAPAYDITFSYRPDSMWVSAHQMLINGKADRIEKDDLLITAKRAGIKAGEAENIIEDVCAAIRGWNEFADTAGLSDRNGEQIATLLDYSVIHG